MEKRVRSPNYPALSLGDALERTATLYKNLHTHSAPREVVVKNMGYNSLNGASATAVSALSKYGLLERIGEELKVSDRALRILHPHSPGERAQAIREAARDPALFAELAERFPGKAPNDELLKNYLVRNGFAPSAVPAVILAYRDTSDFVEREGGAYDSGSNAASERPAMQTQQPSTQPQTNLANFPHLAAALRDEEPRERPIGRYDFEGGGHVRIMAGPDVDIEEALDMVETLIQLKRKELDRKRKSGLTASVAPDHVKGSEPGNWDDENA